MYFCRQKSRTDYKKLIHYSASLHLEVRGGMQRKPSEVGELGHHSSAPRLSSPPHAFVKSCSMQVYYVVATKKEIGQHDGAPTLPPSCSASQLTIDRIYQPTNQPSPLHLKESRHHDDCAPQQLEIADGGEHEPDLSQVRPREVEHRGDHQPPQHAPGHARRALVGRLHSLDV